jgi:MoaA/NifB/PqqE/SkfB family radical SAM enzyme
MYFELTYRCTCKCKFCERWKVGPKRARQELTTKEIKKILKEAYSLGVRYLGFTGGEPLLKKDLFEIAQFAQKIGFTVTIASNGTLINEKNIKEIARSFNSVAISMDGINAKTHDGLRGVEGVYERAMKALELLKSEKVPVVVNMVITNENFREIDQYLQFFSQKNIPVQFTPVHDCDANLLKVADKKLKQIDMKEFRKEWRTLAKKYSLFNNGYYQHVPTFLSTPSKLLHAYTCFAGAAMFFVNPYGEIYPCEFYRRSMGNIKEESLRDIWQKARQLRRFIASSKRPCVCWSHCAVPLNNRLTRFVSLKKGI